MQRIYLLEGKVQHYSWGGDQYIPQLTGVENAARKPFAEYWLGAHPAQSSVLHTGTGEEALHPLIEKDPVKFLGPQTAAQFGGLPFLLKVLDVRQMLSIQVHPNLEQGAEGFERETAAGIPVSSPQRNYKDTNHKPELMVALSDFWLLHGFQPEEKLVETLNAIPQFEPLIAIFKSSGYKGLLEYALQPENRDADAMLQSLRDTILPRYERGQLAKDSPHFWAARAFQTFCKEGRLDKGIFSIYFFNLLHLKTGEGIFQDAGLPHAYLEGQNVEIMANSDNVLRAGLTDKHIDIPELLKLVRFEPTYPAIVAASGTKVISYDAPAAEFGLTQYRLEEEESLTIDCQAAAIALVLAGKIVASEGETNLELAQGGSCFCLAGTRVCLRALEKAQLFIATTPNKN